jgi:hypothetical protein
MSFPREGVALGLLAQVPPLSNAARVVLAGGIPTAVPSISGVWRENVHPGTHDQHAVAYDEARGRLVLFGGRTSQGYGTSTYEWDGQQWHRVTSAGPAPRHGHRMVYDSSRQCILLFGGVQSVGSGLVFFNDTWEWDGSIWTQVATIGPEARAQYSMAYDAVRERVVLFGGRSSTPEGAVTWYDDTWEWNGTAWAQVDDGNGPTARQNAGMVYDAARDHVVLFGGLDYVDYVGDTWEWDGEAWTEVITEGPPCRAFHTMSYDADRERIVVFGGAAPCVNWPFAADQQDTWEWDGETWTEIATTGPFKRRFAGMAYDTVRERTVLFGGWPAYFLPEGGGSVQSDLPVGDLWEWDGQVWVERVATIPRARMAHRMAYDSIRDVTVMYGGRVSIFDYQNETWEWDGQGWTRLNWGGPIGDNNPQARGLHSMTFDSQRGLVWMFGGARGNAGNPLDETWSWDGTTWAIHEPETKPAARWAHNMVYDSARDRVVLFGGLDDSAQSLGDTWEWDGSDWTLRSMSGPSPRADHAMAYDAARGRVVLVGGWEAFNSNVPYDDTWEWDGNSWTLVAQSTLPGRAAAAMAYDSDCERVVLRGGLTNNGGVLELLDDTWEWDGSGWAMATNVGPGPRHSEAMIYESSRSRMFIFGGTPEVGMNGPYLVEMWTLHALEDFDADGSVGASDLALLLGSWGPCSDEGECPADLDGNDEVGAEDLAQLLGSWGLCG